MLYLRNLCLTYGEQPIFDDITLSLAEDQRVGLVGRNGSGKSTLLKAISHQLPLDSGTVSLAGNKRIAYMPQEVVMQSTRTILEEALSSFEELDRLTQAIARLEQQMEQGVGDDLFDEYAALQAELSHSQPERVRAETERMLMGLGFTASQFEQPVATLSVGWKMRIVLAKLLLKKADFYLFDEPTNHLDLIAKEWFLAFLKKAPFGFLIVCHERYFLDELCTHIFEMERGRGTLYTGNYVDYLVQKEHNFALLQAAHSQQQKDLKKKEQTIERFRASASKAKMAKSMEKSLEKIERIEIPPSPKDVHFSFPPVERSGRIVVSVKDVAQRFGDREIFKRVSFEIERDWKVAMVAANGVGKTTLFNIIAGLVPLQEGSIVLGNNVTTTIFAQEQDTVLEKDMSILENVNNHCSQQPEQKIRTFLGSFLFSGDDVKKPIKVLSGGEKNRVGMVCVLLQNTNFLLLDEPTNHLDIPSKEVLLKALRSYQGTLLFVSHDRDFVNGLATHIIELTAEGAYLYEGNYDAFRAHKEYLARQAALSAPQDKIVVQQKQTVSSEKSSPAAEQQALRKQIQTIERAIYQVEVEIKKLERSFETLAYGTPEFMKTTEEFARKQADRDQKIAEWEKLQLVIDQK